MAALAAADREQMLLWTQRGVDLARRSQDSQAAYWLGPLFNNLGWAYFDDAQRAHARLALPLLAAAEASFTEDGERAERLRTLEAA